MNACRPHFEPAQCTDAKLVRCDTCKRKYPLDTVRIDADDEVTCPECVSDEEQNRASIFGWLNEAPANPQPPSDPFDLRPRLLERAR